MNNLALTPGGREFRSAASLAARGCRSYRVILTALAISLLARQGASADPPVLYGFYTVPPCRVVDTRNATGPYGGPALVANSERTFVMWGRCGVPSSADAVVINVTATGATAGGSLRISAAGTPLLNASTINYSAGRTRANNGSYKLGSGGGLIVRAEQAGGTIHLILDVAGYYETVATPPPPPPPSGSLFSKWYLANGDERGRSIAVDTAGNVAVAGQFQGVVDFGAGPITSYSNPSSGPTSDAFVAKYSPSGAPIWSRGLGGNASDSAGGVAADGSGGVVVTGYQGSATVDFGAGPLGNRGITDIFAARYSSTGAHIWSKTIGGTGADGGTAAATDLGGNVFLTGYMSAGSGVDFGGGALTSAGGQDVFLVKYSSTGGHLWSRRFGGPGFDQGAGVDVDGAGNVVVVGNFDGTVDFGGGPLTSVGGRDLFVAKFSPTGGHVWSKRFGGTGNDDVRGIAVDGAGDVLVTGQFLGTINFGGANLSSAGYEDIFLSKLAGSTGSHVWSKRIGSSSSPDAGYGVTVDGNFNVAITGYFAGSVDFGGGAILAQAYDSFVAKFSSQGAFVSSRRFGDPSGQFNGQYGTAIAMSSGGSVYFTGYFQGTLSLGAAGQGTSTALGGNDGFLASVGP